MANSIYLLLSHFFARYGYWVVFFGVMLENIGLPVPGETVLLFAGFLAFGGKIHIVPAILTAIAGATVGAILGFLLGRYAGTWIASRLVQRYRHFAKRYGQAQETFRKHGKWAIFGARFITGVRVFAGILAGTMHMSFVQFLFYTFAGAVCWAIAIGLVGFEFGSNWTALVSFVGRMNRILLAVIAVGAAVWFAAHLIRRRKIES